MGQKGAAHDFVGYFNLAIKKDFELYLPLEM